VDGRQVWKGTVERNAMHLVRAGEAVRALWRGSGRVLHLYIPHELLVDVAHEFDHAEFELMERGLHVDPRWHALSAMLLERIDTRDKLAQLEIDNIGMMACAQLLRSWSTVRTEEAKGRLGQWQTRRAIDFLMDHLDTDIGVRDLASHVGLSQFHFTRAFRQTVGVSPHRYLLLRRLDRAKELLERTALSVTAIAARVGYQDPNQLARLFRAELRTTPTAYRRKRRR
jgi:AraC family transcriptional regulator